VTAIAGNSLKCDGIEEGRCGGRQRPSSFWCDDGEEPWQRRINRRRSMTRGNAVIPHAGASRRAPVLTAATRANISTVSRTLAHVAADTPTAGGVRAGPFVFLTGVFSVFASPSTALLARALPAPSLADTVASSSGFSRSDNTRRGPQGCRETAPGAKANRRPAVLLTERRSQCQ